MRTFLACVALSVVVVAQDNVQFSDPNVEDVFRYARMAVGGGAVAKIRTLELKGQSKIVNADASFIDCDVDIRILLPDHYLRIDATASDAKLAGFAGKNVLNAIRSGGNLSLPPANLTSAILKNERARLARLLLGGITYVTPEQLLLFHSSGLTGGMIDPRESAKTAARMEGRGEPNVAEITGPEGFHARMIVDASSRWPTRLMYRSGSQDETITFEDRREIDGLKLPYRITTSVGGRVIDALIFDEIRVNPEMSKGDFHR
jgi:hypothetical protein